VTDSTALYVFRASTAQRSSWHRHCEVAPEMASHAGRVTELRHLPVTGLRLPPESGGTASTDTKALLRPRFRSVQYWSFDAAMGLTKTAPALRRQACHPVSTLKSQTRLHREYAPASIPNRQPGQQETPRRAGVNSWHGRQLTLMRCSGEAPATEPQVNPVTGCLQLSANCLRVSHSHNQFSICWRNLNAPS